MILTEEKAAFAAEHHEVITQYLKERRLSPDEYYDTVVFAFLDCVISGKDNFKKRAYAAMDRAVAAVKAESEAQELAYKPDRAQNRSISFLLCGYHAAAGVKAYGFKACCGDND